MSRRVPLIVGGAVIVLLLGWYVAVWRPAVASSGRAQAAKAAAVVTQQQLVSNLARLVTLQRTLAAEEAKLGQAEVAVPSSASVDTVIDQIDAIAVADNISWTNESQTLGAASAPATTTPTTSTSATKTSTSSTTTPPSSGVTTGSGDSTLALNLQVAGSYQAMTRFIGDLGKIPRLIVIDMLSYAPTGQTLAVSIVARAFYNSTPSPTISKTTSGT